jgi:chaperone modulatory protein CbpM
MAIRYISIHEFCEFHGVDRSVVEEFVEFEFVEPTQLDREPALRESDLEPLETAVRLYRDLGVNPAGIETILHMRERLRHLQARMRDLELRLRRYE